MTDPTTVNESFGKLRAIEAELGALFVEREEVVRAMLLALLSREHLALIGPPGTAKSMLIIELAKRVGDSAGNGLRCFVYLLTKFTTPEELFGPVSISGLKADDYRRVTTGKLADTELADQAASVYDATMTAHGQSSDTQQKVVVVAEGIDKLKTIHAGLVQLQEQAAAKGRATGKIEKAVASVQEMREKVGALILGAM
jgi:hypothetical protein